MNQAFESSEEDDWLESGEEEEEDNDNWIDGCDSIQSLDVELAYWDPDGEFQGKDYLNYFYNDFSWDSKEELYEWVKGRGKELAMALIRKNTSPYSVSIVCERYGESRKVLEDANKIGKGEMSKPKPKLRRSHSKKCGCKFELLGYRQKKDSGIPNPKWVVGVLEGRHNHPINFDLAGNAFMGRMTPEEQVVARKWGDGRNTPKQIVAKLRSDDPSNLTKRKQVSNFLYKLQYEDRGELTVTQWSLKFLAENEYVFSPIRDQNTNEVQILFFAHKESLRLLKKFPYVVIIDATYKTNKYKMPLVEIVGFTCTHLTFNIAYAFTRAEKTYHYTWIMRKLRALFEDLGVMPTAIMTDCEMALINGIRSVFGDEVQHLLCWVHIKHNIEAHASKILKGKAKVDVFAGQCWGLFCSTTEESYEKRLEKLRCTWKSGKGGLVGYVESMWLNPYKKSIVRAWTDRHLHFFTRTSNRVEGMHRVLKDIIGSSRGGFNRVIVRIHHAIIAQIDEIRASMNMSLSKRPTDFDDPWMPPEIRMVFQKLFYKVSDKCFDHLLGSYRRILNEDYSEVCTDHWVRDCLGLPCVHEIANAIISRKPLVPDDIHDFWKQLSWENNTPTIDSTSDNERLTIPEIRLREMWAKLQDGTLKQSTMYQLGELYTELEYPDQSTMVEPTFDPQKRGKGRPRGARNKDKEDAREKCHFEHMRKELGELEKNKAKEMGQAKSRGRPRKDKASTSPVVLNFEDLQSQPIVEEESQREEAVEPIIHLGVNFGVGNIDDCWVRYIRFARDVRADGHCGYRSLSVLLGYEEQDYKTVRTELLAELVENKELYEPIRRRLREGSWGDLLRQVNYTRSPCAREYWLDIPFIGLVFATRYQVGLVVLSWSAPTLCLPLRCRSSETGVPLVNGGIALVGDRDHWVPVVLRDDSPLPHPPGSWSQHAADNIKWWTSQLESRVNMYRDYRIASDRDPDPWM